MTLKGISLFKKNGVYYLAYTDELGSPKYLNFACFKTSKDKYDILHLSIKKCHIIKE